MEKRQINIVLNDTPESQKIINTINLPYTVDTIKYPGISKLNMYEMRQLMQKTGCKVQLHGLLGINGTSPNILSPNFMQDLDIDGSWQLLLGSKTETISFHLGTGKETDSELQLKKTLCCNMDFLRRNILDDCKTIKYFSLENIHPVKVCHAADANFISTAVCIANSNFLLDLSHALATARILKISPMKYIKSLPLEKVHELHFSGTIFSRKGTITHTKCTTKDYNFLKELLPLLPNLETITLEYGCPGINELASKQGVPLPHLSYNEFNNAAYVDILVQYFETYNILIHLGYC